jgi:hypothetical protein
MRAEQQDAMMLVRAELCRRVDRLEAPARRRSPAELSGAIGAIGHLAAAYGLTPVVRLAEAAQRALAQGGCPAALYLDRLHDAIGCTRNDEQAGEAMIASVSVRLTA